MSILLTEVTSHLLTIIEYELAKNEPEIIAMVENEIELLINKLQNYLSHKSTS